MTEFETSRDERRIFLEVFGLMADMKARQGRFSASEYPPLFVKLRIRVRRVPQADYILRPIKCKGGKYRGAAGRAGEKSGSAIEKKPFLRIIE